MMRQPKSGTTRAWVEVDLGALRRNGETLARRSGVPLLPMIKADAYGLGAVPVARALESLDPWGFGVATVHEGQELRAAGVERRILVLTPLLPDDFAAARAARLTPVLGDTGSIARWAAEGGGAWHLGIDTGMARAGMRWSDVGTARELLATVPPEGACTHYHSAERGDDTIAVQERRFVEAVGELPARPAVLHAENSPAVERVGASRWDLVRPGIFLYGVDTGRDVRAEPVAHLRGRVVELRQLEDGETVSYAATYRAVGRRRIATVALGYADGYRRALSNRGTALVGGRRVPVAGLVTMDMTMLDVTDVPCEVGDVATMIGRDGGELLDVATVALDGDLSPYEVLAGLGSRLDRVYVGGDA